MGCSSMAEHATVNRAVGGSSPPAPAALIDDDERAPSGARFAFRVSRFAFRVSRFALPAPPCSSRPGRGAVRPPGRVRHSRARAIGRGTRRDLRRAGACGGRPFRVRGALSTALSDRARTLATRRSHTPFPRPPGVGFGSLGIIGDPGTSSSPAPSWRSRTSASPGNRSPPVNGSSSPSSRSRRSPSPPPTRCPARDCSPSPASPHAGVRPDSAGA